MRRFVDALMFDQNGRMSKEPIWDGSTKNLLYGLIWYITQYCDAHRHNLGEVLDILSLSAQELEEFTAKLLVLMDSDEKAKNDKKLKKLTKVLLEGKSTTKITDNAIMQALTVLDWVGDDAFEDILGSSTFSFEELQTEKITVYIVIPEDGIDSCAVWVRAILESAIFSAQDIFKLKKKHTIELRQEERILFLIDELPAFGKLDIVDNGTAILRGRGINLWLFAQNLSQIKNIYKEKTSSIIEAASLMQVFASSELEQLEYLVRVIGDEYYNVLTAGYGETDMEGTSKATTKSQTKNKSQTVARAIGTADSIANNKGINWNEAYGNAKNWNNSKSKGGGEGVGSSISDNQGKQKSESRNYERNMLASTSTQNGKNKGRARSNSKNRQSNHSQTESTGRAENYNKSKGGQQSDTTTHTENETETHSHQIGSAETLAESNTITKQHSTNQNISVKQERMKIETVRSLRRKLSGQNQLLSIRGGFHPFFSQRMTNHGKYIDENRYLFPDMAALISSAVFKEICNRPALCYRFNIENQIADFESWGGLGKIKNHLDFCSKNPFDWHDDKVSEIARDFSKFLGMGLKEIVRKMDEVERQIDKYYSHYDEIGLLILSIMKMSKIWDKGIDLAEFNKPTLEALSDIKNFQDQKIEIDPIIDDLQNLPIAEIAEEEVIDFGGGYNSAWLVKTYSEIMQEAVDAAASLKNKLLTKVDKYEKPREFLKYESDNIAELHTAMLDKALAADLEKSHNFIIKNL